MKKIFITLCLVASLFWIGGAFNPVSAAECSVKDADGTVKQVPTSFDFGCDASGESSVSGIILAIINIASATVGVAVVAGIVWAGLNYSAAGGDASKTKEAKDMIFNAIIALFLFIFLFAGANFLVPGGLFN